MYWDITNHRLGINTNAPAYELDLVGSAAKSSGTAWINTSDRRVKKNISPFARGLETIMMVNPVYF